jgi:hypothetical protein
MLPCAPCFGVFSSERVLQEEKITEKQKRKAGNRDEDNFFITG